MPRPTFPFSPSAWRNSAKLRRCSWAARGVWIEILGMLHDSDEYGIVRWPLTELALAAGAPPEMVRELVAKGVLLGHDRQLDEPLTYTPRSGRRDGPTITLVPPQQGPIWFSSRMVRDEYVRGHSGGVTRFGGSSESSPRQRHGASPSGSPSQPHGEPPSDHHAVHHAKDRDLDSKNKKPRPSPSHLTQRELRLLRVHDSPGNGMGARVGARNGGGKSHVTISDENERKARFQAKIAQALGPNGWTIVGSAADPKDPDHARNLALCQAAARSIGKGWLRSWV